MIITQIIKAGGKDFRRSIARFTTIFIQKSIRAMIYDHSSSAINSQYMLSQRGTAVTFMPV
jgi:hypothetical protein